MQNNQLYCDGGVIRENPSSYGGTWAYRIVMDGQVLQECAGIVSVREMLSPVEGVTNNQTEMLALLRGLEALPDLWQGTILTDSQITLMRIFHEASWANIPIWMHKLWQRQRMRLIHFTAFDYVLLDGHPTRAHLKVGIGKRGHPVSEHNLWCDKACTTQAKNFLKVR